VLLDNVQSPQAKYRDENDQK